MATYYGSESLLRGTAAPQVDVGSILKAGSTIQQALNSVRENEIADEERAMKKKLFDQQQDVYKRGVAAENRKLAKEDATAEALRALTNKEGYMAEKMAGESAAIADSLSNLSAEDRAVAEKQIADNYNKDLSKKQWLDTALSGSNVDQGTVLTMKKNLYDVAANTPGTPEFQAKIDADRSEKKWASDLALGKQKEAALFSDSLARKRESDKELKENELANKLSNLLDVSTTKEVSKEVAVPGTPKEAKAKIEADQAAYGVLYDNYFKKNPNATFEEADNAIRRQLNITVPIDKYFAREDSTKTVVEKELKPKNEYISDLLKVAKEQGIVHPKTLQLIQEQAKTAYEVDKEKIKEAKAVESLKKAIAGEDKKVDTTGIFDSATLKEIYKTIVDRKEKYGTNSSKYGVGGESFTAMDEVGIDMWGEGTQQQVVELAKKYKVTDKDLAAIIRSSDTDWSPTTSSTVVDRIEEKLKAFKER